MTSIGALTENFTPSATYHDSMVNFLLKHGDSFTATHCSQVATECRRVAAIFGLDEEKAYVAGLFHDISAIIPKPERCDVADAWGVPVLEVERKFPMIVHQKLSAHMASTIFEISDSEILSAIGCHTTLKGGASNLDKVVFVADKIRWDQEGRPPYLTSLLAALKRSLDDAAFCYVNYLWKRRKELPIMHPWLEAAYIELSHLTESAS